MRRGNLTYIGLLRQLKELKRIKAEGELPVAPDHDIARLPITNPATKTQIILRRKPR
jgi:hypothetical protein